MKFLKSLKDVRSVFIWTKIAKQQMLYCFVNKVRQHFT